jgi:hypothetical protein
MRKASSEERTSMKRWTFACDLDARDSTALIGTLDRERLMKGDFSLQKLKFVIRRKQYARSFLRNRINIETDALNFDLKYFADIAHQSEVVIQRSNRPSETRNRIAKTCRIGKVLRD